MNLIETFIGVLCALIVKDIYDIFIQNHLKRLFSKYKLFLKIEKVIKE